MTEQERKEYHDKFGYDPEYYLHQETDIRQYLNFVNKDSVQKLYEAFKKLESQRESDS